MLSADRNQVAKHFAALWANADPGTFVSLRGFEDGKGGKAWGYADHWGMLPVTDSFAAIIAASAGFATAAANTADPVVVCPPACTFSNSTTATEADLANGLVILVEIDVNAAAGKARLEAILGPATQIVASGGTSVDPVTGAVEDRLHVYWRLAKPTRTPEEHARLKEARDLAARLIGSDTSAVPSVHPIRMPGSWHRKTATPRLTRIVGGDPDAEVVLDEALEKLRAAAGVPPGLGSASLHGMPQAPPLDILAALWCIPNDDSGTAQQSWDQWNLTGMQLYAAFGGSPAGLAAFHAWSAQSQKYNAANTDERWKHWRQHGPTRTGVGALFNRATAANPNFVRPSAQPQPSPSPPSAPPQKPWPVIDDAAFHGAVGEAVEILEPHTEADKVAILIHLLVEVGNVIGRHPYYLVEATRHYTNLFALIVGSTAKARKGTSADRAKQILEAIDPDWAQDHCHTGLSSGEGLIYHVRDPVEELVWQGKGIDRHQVLEVTDKGVEDKRLLVIESEFARTVSVMERPGNTLSAVLRAAWDRGDLETLTRTTKAKATDAHISVIGHITGAELSERLTSNDKANGFANRFLIALVRRSQLLPFGGSLNPADLLPVTQKIAHAVELAEAFGRVELSVSRAGILEGNLCGASKGKIRTGRLGTGPRRGPGDPAGTDLRPTRRAVGDRHAAP
jgi:hypothetical protein